MERERVQKVLARAGIGSRRHCEELIEDGLVRINGELANSVWALFVSFDALQAWLGAAIYVTALRVFSRRSMPEERSR